MSNLEFFKKQAKNLLKDWQTQRKVVEVDGSISYHYDWKFYDVGDLFFYYEFDDKDEQDIKLMRAQHLIAKMAGFKNWNVLINASETELELAELLLRKFKNAHDIQDWEETLMFTGVAKHGPEAVLAYARQYYRLEDTKEIVHLPMDKITVLSGKLRAEALSQFDDSHNPAGILRKNSSVLDYKVLTPTLMYGEAKFAELERGITAFLRFALDSKVHCIHCGKEYLYREANVVVSPDDGEAYIQCKHFPECDGTLIDMVLVDKTGGQE